MRITIVDENSVLKEISFESTDYNDSLLIAKIIEYTVTDNFNKFKKEILQEIKDKENETLRQSRNIQSAIAQCDE